ncbi:MAG TPA: CpaF family protein [Hungateiclostridium thermocellum]|jgi:pilus assembly protein CpaF|uniref:Type II secretion system protein E n=2 Tax=Acetivibrio thermocellus TaxID=1515 RepID=A3DF42_ACET2|nr:CpaF family protein [Acetivibrio thermocellus]CDG36014.1 type II secretion system protein E [Acetivibrio thermocellus BC1]ABN52571.1 type II secretion system protein E [Acetivibrio thermocellus ATCC 27405]ADU73982.1 type II secretion system protein E [Acetivibrio thermocellus DSM 1313]ALX07920.1 type II secretion system protein E [Acetivibrio thermocellus AD2]ANV75666.1 type II secretion system protein E [Acetivibrio thermocellus DSM 2360]
MELEEKEKLIAQIRKHISENLDLRKDFSDEEIKDIITNVVFERSRDYYLSVGEKKEIADAIFNSMRRLDVLQPLIDDKSITEIMINGPDSIFIERDGRVSKLNVKFESRRKLEDVIQTIVSRVNRTVNEASPIVDARLPDGSRVNVVLPPIALNGPVVTIRKFPEKPMTIEQLIKYGSITEEVAEVLERLVKAKYNIFICGGTGSGKTTFLNALSNFIPKDERIVTIEDSAELQITGVENIVRLETRNANTEGKGEITIRDLIRTSLRMRPERIIVGEVRGKEALDMLQAMNTGHDGSLSTGHANSTKDMLSRLETMVLSGAEMPLEAIRQQIASAIDIIIHLGRLRDKSRRTLEITEVVEYKNGQIVLNPLYEFVEEGETPEKQVIGTLRRTKNEMVNKLKFKMAGISDKF